MRRSPVIIGKKAEWYAQRYYQIEDDILPIFERLDTPFLDKRIKPGMKVLDAMMGRGRHAIRYAKRGCAVHGNDLNPHMVALARRSAKAAHAKLAFSTLDATTLRGIKRDAFDITIAMFSAVGTIPDEERRQRALDAFARVTRPGGLVIVHAHNRLDMFLHPPSIPWAIKTYVWPSRDLRTGDMIANYNGLQKMFNHFYSPREFRKSFERAGLRVVEEAYMQYDPPRFLHGPLRKMTADGFIFVGRKE